MSCAPGLILRGLLNPSTANQVRVSKEYCQNHLFFEKTLKMYSEAKAQLEDFKKWKGRLLYDWQYRVLDRLMRQDERKIMWLVDRDGNHGKTFLGMYLNNLYNFQYFNTAINTRDIVQLLDPTISGVSIDISRASLSMFDYSCIESLKNGIVITGKYRGDRKRLDPIKVICFANNYPDLNQLSEDRWEVVVLGEGSFINLERIAITSPSVKYPFVKPPALPDLSDSIPLREYLMPRVESLNSTELLDETIGEAPPSLNGKIMYFNNFKYDIHYEHSIS